MKLKSILHSDTILQTSPDQSRVVKAGSVLAMGPFYRFACIIDPSQGWVSSIELSPSTLCRCSYHPTFNKCFEFVYKKLVLGRPNSSSHIG